MKKSTRILAMLLALLLVTSVMTGCSNEKPATPDKTTVTTEASSGTTQPTTQEPKKELEGTITINTGAGPGLQEAWESLANGYMALNPKVKVVVDLKPFEGYADWIKAMFGSKNPEADLVNINMAGPAATGKSINYMEYANNKSPYSEGAWKDQFNFAMQQKDLAKNEWNYISLESVQVLWCYNKEIFTKVGVEPPSTWEELVKVSEKIQAAGYQPISVPGDFNGFWTNALAWLSWVYNDQTNRSMIEKVRAQEGDYCYDPEVDGKFIFDPSDPFNDDSWNVNVNPVRLMKAIKDGTYAADSAGFRKVQENFKMVFPKYSGGDSFFGIKDALPAFYQGKAAMLVDGAWRLAAFKNDMEKLSKGEEIISADKKIEGVQKFELGTFNMPSMEGPEFEAPARTIEVAVGFIGAVKKDKAHDDVVMDFLMYYSSTEGYSKFLSDGLKAGLSPAGPPLVNNVELPPEYASLFANLQFIGNCQKAVGPALARGVPGDVQESLRDWYGYTQEFYSGKITVDEWGKRHKANISKYFDESLMSQKINPSDLDNPQNAPTGK